MQLTCELQRRFLLGLDVCQYVQHDRAFEMHVVHHDATSQAHAHDRNVSDQGCCLLAKLWLLLASILQQGCQIEGEKFTAEMNFAD